MNLLLKFQAFLPCPKWIAKKYKMLCKIIWYDYMSFSFEDSYQANICVILRYESVLRTVHLDTSLQSQTDTAGKYSNNICVC